MKLQWMSGIVLPLVLGNFAHANAHHEIREHDLPSISQHDATKKLTAPEMKRLIPQMQALKSRTDRDDTLNLEFRAASQYRQVDFFENILKCHSAWISKGEIDVIYVDSSIVVQGLPLIQRTLIEKLGRIFSLRFEILQLNARDQSLPTLLYSTEYVFDVQDFNTI